MKWAMLLVSLQPLVVHIVHFFSHFLCLCLCRGAHIDVRNKKGNTPLWLAANGGHFDVVQLLVHASADVDAADNRKITPLMAAFRKVQSLSEPWLVACLTELGQSSVY